MSNTIKVSGGFSVGNSEPVDDRSIVANITARDAIESYRRYVGMETTVLDGGGGLMKKYKLSGGTANSNWVDISDNGTIQARSTNATANTIPLRDSNGKFQIKLDVDRIYIGNTFGNAEPRILPYSLTGHGGKAIAVRSDLTGYEYVPFPTGSLNNVTVKTGVTGLTATKTGDNVELDASYPSALVQSTTGYQVLKSISSNKLLGATLVQGSNITISETDGEAIGGLVTKRLTISVANTTWANIQSKPNWTGFMPVSVLAGKANKALMVNPTETGYEYATVVGSVAIDPATTGATANTSGMDVTLAFDYPSAVGATSGFNVVDQITQNTLFTKALRAGTGVTITETNSGSTVGNPPIPLKYLTVEATAPVIGTNTQVIFNDNGVLSGSPDFTYDKTNKFLKISQQLECDIFGNVRFGSYLGTQGGTNNTIIGSFARQSKAGNYIVAIGNQAGRYTDNSDYKLYIESNTRRNQNSDHLIEGDFNQRWVKFNGAVLKRVNNITAPASALTTGTVTSYLDGVITDASKTFTVNEYSDKLLIITGGLGVGIVSKINSNTVNTISLTHYLSGMLDSTSTYKIVETTNISNEKFNSEYLVDLSTEDYFIYFNNFPNFSQEINITINKNPNNKNLWIAGETTNGLVIFPYKVSYKSYNTPLITHTFKAYRQDGFIKGYLETSNDLNNLLQPIKTSTKDLVIDLYSKIYKIDVAAPTTVTFNIDSSYTPILTGNSLTIELDINMTVVSAITWPVNVTWIGGTAPTFGSIAKYRLVFRTEDAGTTWIANLAYKIPYSLNPLGINSIVELTDLDILRQIRDANPTSQLPIIWSDDEDPYTQWEEVYWVDGRVTEIGRRGLDSKGITSLLNVNKLTNLQKLVVPNNLITEVDLSGLIHLTQVRVNLNRITYINISGCANLVDISVKNNLLTSIPTLTSKGNIIDYCFTYNNFPTVELDRFRAMGFTDEYELLPQNA